MARKWLEKNTRNRPISEAQVYRFAEDMMAGRWQYNGEAIKWSTLNELLDGQHRLLGLSLLDDSVSIPFLVVTGLPTASQSTMDQGRTRTAGDQLNIDKITDKTDSRVFAGAVRVYLVWQRGALFGDATKNRIGNPEVIAWAKGHPAEVAMMHDIINEGIRKRVKCRPSITVAVLLHLRMIDDEAAAEFAEKLTSGAGLDTGNPILTLRERLDRIRNQGVKTSDRDVIAFFIIAWNAWRDGRTMDKFQRPRGGSWTEDTFPVPR
jgi:hypothetical protein